MNCRFKHKGNGLPCMECNQEEYDRCMLENNQGKNPPHDLTQLRKLLGIKYEEPTNTIIENETKWLDDKSNDVKLKEYLHGYRKEPPPESSS